MSSTATVEFGGRGLWAYAGSLAILLATVIKLAEDLPSDRRSSWLPDMLDTMKASAVVTDFGLVIDESWHGERVDLLATLVAKANQQLRDQATISEAEVAHWNVLDGDTVTWRGSPIVDTAPVVDLGMAIIQLIDGTLPYPPPGTWWYYGVDGGPSTIVMYGDMDVAG